LSSNEDTKSDADLNDWETSFDDSPALKKGIVGGAGTYTIYEYILLTQEGSVMGW